MIFKVIINLTPVKSLEFYSGVQETSFSLSFLSFSSFIKKKKIIIWQNIQNPPLPHYHNPPTTVIPSRVDQRRASVERPLKPILLPRNTADMLRSRVLHSGYRNIESHCNHWWQNALIITKSVQSGRWEVLLGCVLGTDDLGTVLTTLCVLLRASEFYTH